MKIESAKYAIDRKIGSPNIFATIDGVKMTVPQDPDNMHFAEIQKQVADKKLTIKEAD
tara:strand:- start:496 stop:669 length:174 start_codon:yes stop_codon:yes gene_type:complete